MGARQTKLLAGQRAMFTRHEPHPPWTGGVPVIV